VLKDERFVKNYRAAMSAEQIAQFPSSADVFNSLSQSLLETDGAAHRRLRGLVHKAFAPQLIDQMRRRIQQIANELLDHAQHKGEMDLIADYAFPLPITVIAEMLGVPVADRDKFRRWSNVLVNQAYSTDTQQVTSAAIEFSTYLYEIIEERRHQPKDDLITRLVQAEEAGDQLSEDELLSMIVLLLIAGHETTVNLIGNGVLALLEHPDQLNTLRRTPSLVPTAIEELLRYTSPVEIATERYASEDIVIAGTLIPKGEWVAVVLASANHDAEQFDDPETLDITREDNRHIAFGFGVHYCLGAPLARLEGQIAIPTLLKRLPKLALATAPAKLRWRQSLFLRGLEALPVSF
jgi:cytochrome P450 PksS